MARPLRLLMPNAFLFAPNYLIALLLSLSSFMLLTVPAFAWASPGDLYVFGADSAVSPDVNVEQNSAAASGDNVVWMGYFNYNGARKDRVFYRDISDPESQAYMLAPRLDSNIQQSNAVISGDLVVWLESGMSKEIHYTYLGAGCPGACLEAMAPRGPQPLPNTAPYGMIPFPGLTASAGTAPILAKRSPAG